MRPTLFLIALILIPVGGLAQPKGTPAEASAQPKRAVERADQLPVHSYAVARPPSALLKDDEAMGLLAERVRADLEADLAAYDIRDRATLRSYERTLGTIAMLQRLFDEALQHEARARELEEKPAARILSGLTLRPVVAAETATGGGAASVFAKAYAAELARLPYDSVQTELKTARARMETVTPAVLEGIAAAELDPGASAGTISKEAAVRLLNLRFSLRYVVPYREEMARQLTGLIESHRTEKPDIWAARNVSLDGKARLTPVVIAINDTGVDTGLFGGLTWNNAKEVPGNGKDDDHDGFVDDAHGIAWSWDGKPLSGDLRSIDLSPSDLATAKASLKGFLDMQAGLDSPEAGALRRAIAAMSKEQVKPLIEGISFFQTYAHGTHVAGIAAQGNPAARLLVVRIEAPYRLVPPPPTAAWASGFAAAMKRSVAYYKRAGVRVVNMSWGFTAQALEHDLEMNNIGSTPEERHRMAMDSYGTVKKALREAIASAPEILFISAAGNSDESNQFNEVIPASFDLPNTLTVGAVDRAGDEAAFTSFGRVDLYANGYEVESVLPGGERQRWSGTSMASPQVVNLAAKLFAAHPSLKTSQAKGLILEGADTKNVSGGRSIRLLNPSRSFERADAARP